MQKLGLYNYRRGWLKGDCPSCGKHKFGIHLGLNRSNCFSCEYNIKPIDLVMQLESIETIHEVHALLNNIDGIEYVEPIIEPYQLKKNTVLPDSYVNIRRGDNRFGKTARNILVRRGFNITKLSRAGWGYCTKGKYQGYIIMPFYLNGKLIYFNARKFLGDGPKFNNPDIDDFGLGKSMILYNIDALYMFNKIYLVESVMNSETIGSNGIATGGKKLSNYQLNTIIKSPVKKVIIGLDDDAIDDAIRVAFKLIDHKKVKILLMPKKQDVNDIGKKATKKLEMKSRYLNHKSLMKLKHDYA
jgi:hypothetical protein